MLCLALTSACANAVYQAPTTGDRASLSVATHLGGPFSKTMVFVQDEACSTLRPRAHKVAEIRGRDGSRQHAPLDADNRDAILLHQDRFPVDIVIPANGPLFMRLVNTWRPPNGTQGGYCDAALGFLPEAGGEYRLHHSFARDAPDETSGAFGDLYCHLDIVRVVRDEDAGTRVVPIAADRVLPRDQSKCRLLTFR